MSGWEFEKWSRTFLRELAIASVRFRAHRWSAVARRGMKAVTWRKLVAMKICGGREKEGRGASVRGQKLERGLIRLLL
jgi:hypothetical protein